MQIYFYKGKGKFFDKLIRWWTKSKYSHCELCFSDGTFFSADAWENKVRYTAFQPDPTSWDYAELHLNQKEEMRVRAWCDSKVGKKYDWLGILFAQVLRVGVDDPSRYFCSEVCIEALKQVPRLLGIDSCDFSPGDLAKIYGLG